MKESQDQTAIVCQTQQAKGPLDERKKGGGDGERWEAGVGGRREEADEGEKKRLVCFRVTGSGNHEPLFLSLQTFFDTSDLVFITSITLIHRDHPFNSIRSGEAVTMNNRVYCI